MIFRLAISMIVDKQIIAFVGKLTLNNGLTVIICMAFTNESICFIDIFRNIVRKKFEERVLFIAFPAL